jgi:agmatinase
VELWDEEMRRETWELGICTLPAVDCRGGERAALARIEKAAQSVLERTRAVPFFLGGEHSITQALLRPFIRKYKNLSVFHIDAHADLRPEYEGSACNHACALYPASRTNRVVQAGIRSVAPEEVVFTGSGKVKTFFMHENRDLKKLSKKILSSLTDTVYITIDVDGFDPAVFPGTGTPVPGGFSWYEGLDLLRDVCKNKKIAGVDLVEVCPQKGSVISEFNAAKLIYRLMGYLS